jgi:PEGA domain
VTQSQRLGTIPAILLLLAASGCATVVNGRTQEVTFSSDPLGAAVYVDGNNVGTTPTAANLARNASHTIKIEKPGYVPYETTTVLVESSWSAADDALPLPFGLNLLAGLLITRPADSSLGGMYEIRPTDISAELISGASSPVASNAPVPLANPAKR